jgi:PAS domain S-box-containing protein
MYLTGPDLVNEISASFTILLAHLGSPFHLQIFITPLRLTHRTFATPNYPWDAAMTSDLVLAGSYNYGLVALSILIAMLGSYATIDLAERVKASHGGSRLSWRIGGATAMAIGTWAMHYTGMLAFSLPVPIRYDWPTALLSFLPSLLASSVALLVVIRPKMESRRAFVASFFIGGGIAALHYTAMASMQFQGMHRYSPALVALSVLLAMLFALLSVWLTFLFRDQPRDWKLRKVGSVALMGTAIWGMHYTGMASSSFEESATAPDLSHAVMISSLGAAGLGAVALTVLAVALVTSTVDRLQKGKVLLDELFEQAPEAVVLMSEDQSIVRVNREFTRLFAYTPQEALGRRLSELIVPYEFQDEYEEYADKVAHGQRVDAEGVRQRRDGSRLHVSIVQVPVSLPGGQIAKYAIYRDITERKQAENDLRKQNEVLQTIIDNIPVMIRFLGLDGRVQLVNRTWERTLGWSLEEAQQRNFDMFGELYPDQQERQRALDFVAAATGEWADFRIHAREGRVIDATFANIRLSDGTNISIGQDITERKQAEESLQQAHSRIESVLNSVADIHILFDRDFRYVYVNEAAVRAMGRQREELLGRTLWEVYPDIVGTELGRQYRRAMEERVHVAFDFHYLTLDTWWENRFYPAPEGLSVFATDITERKLAEEKLRATTEQLRALSARLQSAREEEGTRIAREIHDELGAALSSLRWDLEDVDEAISRSEERSQVEELRKKIAAMMRLTDTTVNTVRRIASELRPVALDALGLSEAIEMQAQQFQERTGISVRCDCTLENDLSQEQSTAAFRILQEALTNILRHAQATTVNIQMKKEDSEFILTIRDNGRGITDDEKSGQRTLGLLGMRERAHLIGGKIEITGSDGKGTVVTVRIPISG